MIIITFCKIKKKGSFTVQINFECYTVQFMLIEKDEDECNIAIAIEPFIEEATADTECDFDASDNKAVVIQTTCQEKFCSVIRETEARSNTFFLFAISLIIFFNFYLL